MSSLLVGSGIAAAKPQTEKDEEPEVDTLAKTDDYFLFRVKSGEDTRVMRVSSSGEGEVVAQIMTDGQGTPASADQLGAESVDWEDVVENYNAFITDLDAGRYGGVSIELTDPATHFSKLTLEAAIAGLGAYIVATAELTPVGQALVAAAAVLAAGIVEYVLDGTFTAGVRDSITAGAKYHFETIDPAYDSTVEGTIPVDEPEPGFW